MSDRNQAILYSGGHKGAEAEFGRCAEKWGVRQVTLSYEGHVMEFSKDVEVLPAAELLKGDVSMEIVSKRMGRTYTSIEQIRTVCQLIFHMVSRTYCVFAWAGSRATTPSRAAPAGASSSRSGSTGR